MDSPLVIIERNGPFAIIRLNCPETSDALTREMIVTLDQSFKDLNNQPELRAIILTCSGNGANCAETGIQTESAESTGPTPAEGREVAECRQALYRQIEHGLLPVIAAIEGLAAGDGCELALACHLRIASPNASFSLPTAKPDSMARESAVHRLAREIGNDYALEISRSGRTVLVEEALRIGLINRIAPDGRLVIEAELLARQISAMAPLAIRACLEAVSRGIELPLAEGLALEAHLFSSLFATNDVREGTSAFLEKRQPVFKGS